MSRRQRIVLGALVAFVVTVAGGLTVAFPTKKATAPNPQSSHSGETITIDNRITNGPTVMVEVFS
jgi:hypothetical protein